MAAEAIVRAANVEKAYPGPGSPRVVLRAIDLQVAPGEFLAITGRSGCGKTTLLNLLGAMDIPTRGSITLAGQETARLNDAALTALRRREVGFVFQFFHLLPALSVLENIELPMQLDRRLSTAAIRARAREALAQAGLPDRGAEFPGRLSGGEQQRVALARALAHDPRLVIADEPTGNLDSAGAAEILALLRSLCRQRAAAVVMATHSAEAAAWADHALPLRDGLLETNAPAATHAAPAAPTEVAAFGVPRSDP